MHLPGQAPLRALQTRFSAPRHSVRSHLLAGTAVLVLSGVAHAADFTVTNGGDLLTFTPTTYRQAVQAANGSPGPDRIRFAVDRVVTSASIDVTDSLTIGGTGAPVRIDGAGHFIGRIGFSSSGFAPLDVTIGSNVTIGDFGSGIVGPTAIRLDGVVPTTLRLDGAIVPARLRSSPSGPFSSVDAITASGQATIHLSSTGLIQTQLGRSAIVGLPSLTFGSSFGTVVNINGGTIRADGRGIDAPGASVNMTGGLIEAREDALVLGTGSSLSIAGGRISGGGDGARFVPLFPAFTTRVAMTGGTLEGVAGNGISTASLWTSSSVQVRPSQAGAASLRPDPPSTPPSPAPSRAQAEPRSSSAPRTIP